MSLDAIAHIQTNLRAPAISLSSYDVPLVAALLTGPQDTAWDAAYGASVDVIEVNGSNWQATFAALGITSTEDLHVSFSDMFSQVRQPALALVGRRLAPVAQVEEVEIVAGTDGTFTLTINGNDYIAVASTNTPTEIRDLLLVAIASDLDSDDDGAADVAGAIVDASTLSVSAAVPGVPFTISVEHSTTPASIAVSNTVPTQGIPQDFVSWRAERDDFYFLLETTRLSGNIRAAAEVIETARKLFVAQTSDAGVQTSGTNDIATRLGPVGLNLNRTALFWSQNDDQFVDSAIVGLMGPAQPGSETWNAQPLSSVVGTVPTSETNLIAKRANWLETFTAANFAMTQGGRVSSGQWIDLIRGRDWLDSLIQIRIVTGIRDAGKIPYTNAGAQLIAGFLRGALEEAAEVGLIDATTINIVVPDVSSQSDADRSNRHYPNVYWSATLQGAIHTLDVTGDLAP